MSERCKHSERICQNWPNSGKLKKNMDNTLNTLKEVLEDIDGIVYAYVLTTVNEDGGFVQKGSAPNFQGSLITLSTCKHYMRTYMFPKDWKGVWIAGFTGIDTMKDHLNYLFYLMRVQNAFQSHKELWDWLDPSAKKAKNARYNTCGDVYEPMPSLKNPLKASEYYPPIKNHVHEKNDYWYKDINYLSSKTQKRPALLVGDPTFSFLWSQPKIYFRDKLPRTRKWSDMRDFIQLLVSN